MTYIEKKVDKLNIKIFETRSEMGANAAAEAAEYLRELGKVKEEINIIFAAAPSQDDILGSLIQEKDLPWEKINAMQLDDYIGINGEAPQRFANYLKRHIFDLVSMKQLLLINCENPSVEDELARYNEILKTHPADVAFIGIGENGHIAFNDPSVADFNDKKLIKSVVLEETSRLQQVNDGCFEKLEDVPGMAMTVTIPAILRAERVFCVVPCSSKANAVRDTLNEPVSTKHPATILRTHKNATLYLDKYAATEL
ncbi:MAG: glucosamine-6-phosphate deaminase [Clostridia bacterium BRH_c25]|nr:MAG: glucosamine-6-phosphate deaminase [Clostridia bacterium BRH_c25]